MMTPYALHDNAMAALHLAEIYAARIVDMPDARYTDVRLDTPQQAWYRECLYWMADANKYVGVKLP